MQDCWGSASKAYEDFTIVWSFFTGEISDFCRICYPRGESSLPDFFNISPEKQLLQHHVVCNTPFVVDVGICTNQNSEFLIDCFILTYCFCGLVNLVLTSGE